MGNEMEMVNASKRERERMVHTRSKAKVLENNTPIRYLLYVGIDEVIVLSVHAGGNVQVGLVCGSIV
jgi:hypothetical protein